jgi:NAD(P)-dependent dehydrogenase (short-subunit alcohol dehydrogenase family)
LFAYSNGLADRIGVPQLVGQVLSPKIRGAWETLATCRWYTIATMRKKKWGRFIGISSNMVGLAIAGMSHYIASKMGIIGFMRGLANDVAIDGITANAVLPSLKADEHGFERPRQDNNCSRVFH